MDIDLTKLTEAELIALNQRVVERIKALRQRRYLESMTSLDVGDRVSFRPDCGHAVEATVLRLNRKSVTVLDPHGVEWRVAPTLLTKVAGAPAASGAVGGGTLDNVIPLAGLLEPGR